MPNSQELTFQQAIEIFRAQEQLETIVILLGKTPMHETLRRIFVAWSNAPPAMKPKAPVRFHDGPTLWADLWAAVEPDREGLRRITGLSGDPEPLRPGERGSGFVWGIMFDHDGRRVHGHASQDNRTRPALRGPRCNSFSRENRPAGRAARRRDVQRTQPQARRRTPMTIMSKDSQQAPDPRPDPLAQYPERYAMTPADQGIEAAKTDVNAEPPQEHPIHQIAREHLGIKTLKPQNSDRLDFHELGVSSIEKALRAAYAAGQGASAQPEQPEPTGQPSEEELREMRRLGGSREVSPWGRNSPQPAMPLRGGVRDKYAETSQIEPPEPAVEEPAATAPPHFEQPPKWYDYPEKAAAAVEKVKSLTGGYLTSEEEDGVQSSIRLGQHPYQIVAALRKQRQAAQQQALAQRPSPAFPTVGRPAMPQTRSTAPGSISNAIIRQRNAGVPHQFESSIGGNAANYR